MLVDIVVYQGVDELDVIGPLEVFRRAQALGADLRSRLCAHGSEGPGPEATAEVVGAFGTRFHADAVFHPGDAQVVVVPGGGWVARGEAGAWAEAQRGQWPELLGRAADTGAVMAGVCTGTLLLARAGVIGSRPATTHHDAQRDLADLGATVLVQRVVDDGDLVTSGGVTSGIDLALWLLCRYFGQSLAALVAEGLEYAWAAPAPVEAEPVAIG